jgi:TolB-like protein
MNRTLLYSACLMACLAAAAPLRAAELDSKLGKITAQFAQDAAAKLPGVNPATLAVFPFQAEESLGKRKVDVAVAELLTQKLLREPRFRVVERNNLDTVLREQKLGLSGAVESETAARVGKLAGARLAVLGSVTRLGKSYQISSKLVDTETADVVSVSIVEVRSEVFDEEASRYLVLVPESQTISLYFALGNVPMTTKKLSPVSSGGQTAIPTNAKTSFNPDSGMFPGFGIKYFPFQRWAVNFMIGPKFKVGDSDSQVLTNLGERGKMVSKAEGQMFRLMVHRQFKISKKLNAYAGGGFLRFELDPPNEGSDDTKPVNLGASSGGGTVSMADSFGQGRFNLPLAGLGLEWKPQPRFGLALMANFPLKSETYTWDMLFQNGTRATVWEMTTPKYMAELDISWYF